MSRESDSELSSLYRRGAREEPPAWLDRAIATAAHDEAASRQPVAGGPGVQRWQAPLALAAVLVVAVSVNWWVAPPNAELDVPPAADTQPLAQDPQPYRNLDGFPADAAPVRSAEGVGSVQESNRRLAQAPELPESPAVSEAGDASRARTAKPLLPRQAAVQTAPPSAATDQPRERQTSNPSEPLAGSSDSWGAPPPAAPAPPRTVAPSTGIGAQEARTSESRSVGQASAEERSPVERGDTAAKSASATGDPTRAQTEPTSKRAAARVEGGPTAARKAEAQNLADRGAPTADARSRSRPEQWLKEIEELYRQGRVAEAQEQLAAFRKRFPEHELPRSLRER